MAENIISYDIIETEFGWVGIAGNERGLTRIILPEKSAEDILEELSFSFPAGEKLTREKEMFSSLTKKVRDYFKGIPAAFNREKTDLDGFTPFQKKVLLLTKEIPYGATRTYRGLAEQSGYPLAYRAVGGVMKANPLPLVIPCHRVLGSNGQLTGFSSRGGLELKRKMLTLEGVQVKFKNG